jgi:glycosyltransferase involved in cell wall biosynthesis
MTRLRSDAETLDGRLADHRARFDELLDRSEARLTRRRFEEAAGMAQVAAALAWHSPTGRLASPRLEVDLVEIARAALPALRLDPRPAGARRILHVLTTAYQVGGHSRLAWHWIERDIAAIHDVALTRQRSEPIPAALLRAVAARGGTIQQLDRGRRGLMARAAELQATAARSHLVVLHIHPFDVVPSLAAAALERDGVRPATILVNHADHVFWIGLRAADLVAHLRASGERLSVARRGLSPERSAILPIPLDPAPPSVDRAAARRGLGVADDDVLAVTIASGYKYGSSAQEGLLPLVEAAVERWPKLRVLAVGPADRPWWQAAARRSGGRIRAVANREDVDPLYAAADVYLDSSPFSSLTSMLEAGQRGVPLLALGSGEDAEVLGFDDPATEGRGVVLDGAAAYLTALGELVGDPHRRLERGRELRAALAAVHEGAGWRGRLEDAYRSADRLHGLPTDPATLLTADIDVEPSGVLDRRLLTLLDAQQSDAPRGVRGHLRLAPFGTRLEELRRSRGSDRPISVLVLVPERGLVLARRAAILATTRWRDLRSLIRAAQRRIHGGGGSS